MLMINNKEEVEVESRTSDGAQVMERIDQKGDSRRICIWGWWLARKTIRILTRKEYRRYV